MTKCRRIDAYRWEIPRSGRMNVPGLIFADDTLMDAIGEDQSLEQVRNVACLPGIVKASMAMPDMHWGYGFPIGGVAAFDAVDGVVSPGGVGYDINCGVRLLRSGLSRSEIEPHLKELVNTLFRNIPSGVGSRRHDLRLQQPEVKRLLTRGAAWAVEHGMGQAEDLQFIESGGVLPGADPAEVSPRAIERGRSQLGTLGSGNHFAEIQVVSEIFSARAAAALGLELDQVTVSIHSGSRGLGYQVCDDFLETMLQASRSYGIRLPDRQLCCAPVGSPEGTRYLSAMAAAANYAFANRQVMTHWVRESFQQVLGMSPADLALDIVYDVCHNIAKMETHQVDGKARRLCVHRKGATRAFPPGHPEVPEPYREVGQPVLIPGDMGRYSFVLVGTEGAYRESWGSTCHGAGRRLSRAAARRSAKGRKIFEELESRGIHLQAEGRRTVMEEIPEAYKDVEEVVQVVHGAGIARRVARLVPVGVIKG